MSCELPCPRRCDSGLNDDQQADGYDTDLDKGRVRMGDRCEITGSRAGKFGSSRGLDLNMLITREFVHYQSPRRT